MDNNIDEDELDDPIILNYFRDDSEEKIKLMNRNESVNIQEICKSGEEDNFSCSHGSVLLPISFFQNLRNLRLLGRCQPLTVQIVDCDKFPLFYKNIKYQGNKVYKVTSKCKESSANYSEINDLCKEKDCQDSEVKILHKKIENKKNTLTCKETERKSFQRLNAMQIKCELEKQVAIRQRFKSKIDFKRNKGLLGLKVKNIECYDKVEKRNSTKMEIIKPKKNVLNTNKVTKSGVDTIDKDLDLNSNNLKQKECKEVKINSEGQTKSLNQHWVTKSKPIQSKQSPAKNSDFQITSPFCTEENYDAKSKQSKITLNKDKTQESNEILKSKVPKKNIKRSNSIQIETKENCCNRETEILKQTKRKKIQKSNTSLSEDKEKKNKNAIKVQSDLIHNDPKSSLYKVSVIFENEKEKLQCSSQSKDTKNSGLKRGNLGEYSVNCNTVTQNPYKTSTEDKKQTKNKKLNISSNLLTINENGEQMIKKNLNHEANTFTNINKDHLMYKNTLFPITVEPRNFKNKHDNKTCENSSISKIASEVIGNSDLNRNGCTNYVYTNTNHFEFNNQCEDSKTSKKLVQKNNLDATIQSIYNRNIMNLNSFGKTKEQTNHCLKEINKPMNVDKTGSTKKLESAIFTCENCTNDTKRTKTFINNNSNLSATSDNVKQIPNIFPHENNTYINLSKELQQPTVFANTSSSLLVDTNKFINPHNNNYFTQPFVKQTTTDVNFAIKSLKDQYLMNQNYYNNQQGNMHFFSQSPNYFQQHHNTNYNHGMNPVQTELNPPKTYVTNVHSHMTKIASQEHNKTTMCAPQNHIQNEINQQNNTQNNSVIGANIAGIVKKINIPVIAKNKNVSTYNSQNKLNVNKCESQNLNIVGDVNKTGKHPLFTELNVLKHPKIFALKADGDNHVMANLRPIQSKNSTCPPTTTQGHNNQNSMQQFTRVKVSHVCINDGSEARRELTTQDKNKSDNIVVIDNRMREKRKISINEYKKRRSNIENCIDLTHDKN